MKVTIPVTIDIDQIGSYTDTALAGAWHALQAADYPFGDGLAEDMTGKLGYEIIRRFLAKADPELYNHQHRHSLGSAIRELGGKYEPGGPNGSPEWHQGQWVRKEEKDGSAAE